MLIDLQKIFRMVLTVAVVTVASTATWRLARVDWGLDHHDRLGDEGAPPNVSRSREFLGDRPLDAAAFRALGDISATAGDKEVAVGFYLTAARREPRDPLVRVKLINHYLAAGDVDAAVHHLDALLRISPGAGAPVLRRVLGSIDNAALRHALASRLALEPPWRELLPSVLTTTADPASAEQLLALLSKSSPLRPPEVALRASLLEQMGLAKDARFVWGTALPTELQPLDGLVFDGGFEFGEGPEPYGWRLRSPVGAAVGLDTSHRAQGRSSLLLLFDGRAVEFSGVSQDIVLTPGRYRLTLLADLALTGSNRPFAWTVVCRTTNVQAARLELPYRTPGWKRFSALFDVPPSCPTQRLSLVHEGRNFAERRLSGRMAFDAIDLQEQRR